MAYREKFICSSVTTRISMLYENQRFLSEKQAWIPSYILAISSSRWPSLILNVIAQTEITQNLWENNWIEITKTGTLLTKQALMLRGSRERGSFRRWFNCFFREKNVELGTQCFSQKYFPRWKRRCYILEFIFIYGSEVH